MSTGRGGLFPTDCLNSAGNQNITPPPHSHRALATTPRRQLPGNQTMLEPLAVVEFVFCLYAFKIGSRETATEEVPFFSTKYSSKHVLVIILHDTNLAGFS